MRAWAKFTAAALASLALLASGCTTYREHLNRGQRLYEENEYERALSIRRDLEADMDSLSLTDQARYAYLRGMTGYRLGFRADARHWLAVGKAVDQEHPGGLSPEWKRRVDEALDDLNRDVFGGAERVDQTSSTAVEHTRDSEGAEPSQEQQKPSGACRSDSDCPSDQVCVSRRCSAP